MTTTFREPKAQEQKVQPIPKGYHSVTPGLTVADAAKAIDFYKRAFNAQEHYRMTAPDGRVLHAEVRIGDSLVMIGQEDATQNIRTPRSFGGSPVSLNLYLEDADATFKQAVDAGAKSLQPVEDAFWGDRYGKLEDPDGHVWGLCTRVENLTPEEIARRGKEWMSRQKGA